MIPPLQSTAIMVVWVLAIAAGCKSSALPHDKKSMNCKDVLQKFDQGQFSNWTGLTPDCTPENIAQYANGSLVQSRQHWLGEKYANASFVRLEFKGHKEPVRLWYRGNEVVCLEVDYPELSNVPGLLDSLGEPAAKLDYYFDVMLNHGGEYVYAHRGITLFMNTKRDKATKIWVYVPMSVDSYRANLHYFEEPREQPYRED